ncbi:LysR substrate-binding domain-containing protein [Vibrio paucivorans]
MRHLKAFHIFHVAASCTSYTQAAKQLNLTHGAVSKQIKTLENFLDQTLFHRQGRNVVLTEEGKLLHTYTTQAFNSLSEGVATLERMKNQSLDVSCEPTLTMRWLMPKLEEFYAQTQIDVRLSTAGGAINLASAGLDLAIRRNDFPIPEQYNVTPLVTEWIGPVCSPAYWDNIQNHLVDAKLLHTETRPCAWRSWFEHSKSAQLAISAEQTFAHFYFCLQAAVDGLGIAIGSYPLVEQELERGNLVAPFGFISTPQQYVVITQKEGASENQQIFINWLKGKFQSCVPN